jgi:polysaccharide export outer membrane protein
MDANSFPAMVRLAAGPGPDHRSPARRATDDEVVGAPRRRTLKTGLVLVAALFVSLAACGSALQRTPPAGPRVATRIAPPADATIPVAAPEYRIQVGDQLEIKFFYSPELNEQVTVRPDGRIALQLIPEMMAAELTVATLTAQLTERYAADLKEPRLTVFVREFGSQRVFVDGEVGRPGIVPLLGQMTALQAISQAGGMKDTARTTEVIVIRRSAANAPFAFRLDLKNARNGRDLAQDVGLAPLDIVFVPRSRVANVNSWLDKYIRQNIPIPFGLQYKFWLQ